MIVPALLLLFVSDAGYAGSKACFGCHADIYRSYRATAMGQSMRPAAALDALHLPASAALTNSGGLAVRVFQESGSWFQSEEKPGVFLDKHPLAYLVGSGINGFTFLAAHDGGLFQAPLSYYSKPARWDFSPGYEKADPGFTRSVTLECVACHSGRAVPKLPSLAVYANPPFAELAIGCENCHGPGSAHAHDPRLPGAIVNPAKLSPRLSEDICLNCHQGSDARILQPGKTLQDLRPGRPLFETIALFKSSGKSPDADLLEHHSALQLSHCFRQSAGKLSCLTCHDPHTQPAPQQAAAYFRAKCLTCHTRTSCRLPSPLRLATDPPDNCIACHMPKRSVAVISHSALTNHRIPARPDEPLPPALPVPSNGVFLLDPLPSRTAAIPDVTLLRAYAELSAQYPAYQQRYLDLLDRLGQSDPADPFVQAALGHRLLAQQKFEEALPHLKQAASLHDLVAARDLAQDLSRLGHDDEALACLERARQDFLFDAVLLKSLTLQYIKTKHYSQARDAMQQYVDLYPQDPFMRGLLARVSQ